MALLTYALGSEVGLRLLLSPSASQVAVRAACTLFGIGFPIYSTHKAIAYKNLAEQEQWLFYWAVYGCFTATEVVFDKLFSWFPFYYHIKFVFLVWLQLPSQFGAHYLYTNLLRPVLLKHQRSLDRVVDGTRNEMSKFILSHQQEAQFVKRIVQKLLISVYQAARDAMQNSRALEGARLALSRTNGSSSSQGSTPAPPASNQDRSGSNDTLADQTAD
ncbi:hypothetical protein CY35_08G093700 [Sphagnum magellanicum]|nr:hypothetical protein CY35_08G093700 [Sphagnum magellanicum]